MKNLRKVLAVALVMMMCIGLMPVRGLAETNGILPPGLEIVVDQGDDPNQPDTPINPNIPIIVVPDNQAVTPEPEPDWDEYYYEEEVKEEPKEENKDEKKDEDKKDEKAEEIILKIILTVGSKDLEKYLNEDKTIIKMDIAPYIKDGRTMIPIRYLAEALEMKVTWDEKTRTVLLEEDKFKIEIPVDTNKIIVNGEETESDVKPEIKMGRTNLPIANIARALGLKDGEDIFWDAVEKKATIIRKITK